MALMLLRRNPFITYFVVFWIVLFHYESLRANYLSPLAGRPLPKFSLLFPPAGWIMFFNIDRSYGFAEVYGRKNGQFALINPHAIFHTKAVGYDNIRRNVLVGVLYQQQAAGFCRYLKWRLPAYEAFAVVYASYPDVIQTPDRIWRQVAYHCE